jgi:DNA-binding response OmpR family regulator
VKIEIVDNEPDNTSVFKMGLEDEGFKVDSFNDPILALSNFKAGLYDLLILDNNMPNINGSASEIYHESLRVPIQTLNDIKRFIPKPLAIDDLVKKVKRELDSQ